VATLDDPAATRQPSPAKPKDHTDGRGQFRKSSFGGAY
jgi:hypothetical protein